MIIMTVDSTIILMQPELYTCIKYMFVDILNTDFDPILQSISLTYILGTIISD